MQKRAKKPANRKRCTDVLRYVELIRVSSRIQAEQDTAENQRRALNRLAKRRPGTRLERIEALAVSGAIPLHETPQGKQLLDLANEGFEELRLWDLDRSLGARAEDPADRLAILSLAREAGAVIVDRTEQVIDPKDELGEMSFILRTFFAAQERRKIIARTRAGRERIAADGGYAGGGHLPYGLSWDSTNREFKIDEERAVFVRELFRRCVEGETCGRLARDFNARGVATRLGGRWQPGTIRRMFRNPVFHGDWTQEKLPVAVPAIVQRELDRRAYRGRRGNKTKSLCVGRLWCPCGQRLYVRKSKSYEYLFCSSRRHEVHGRQPCDYSAQTHRADKVDPVVWGAVEQAVTRPGILLAAIAGEPDVGIDRYREEFARCEQLLKRLVDTEMAITRAFRRGELSPAAWSRQLKEINSDRVNLEESRNLAKQQIEATESVTRSMDDVEEQLAELRTRVQKASPAHRQAIVAALVPDYQPYGVVVWPDGRIAVRGAIPGVNRTHLSAQES